MGTRIKVDNKLSYVTDQPSDENLAEMRDAGFRCIVNLRTEGEPDHDPDAEGETARGLGLDYIHLPVSPSGISPEQIDKFSEAVKDVGGPILVHCASGKRAGLVSAAHSAAEQGLDGDDAVSFAESKGLETGNQQMQLFLKNYVNSRRKT